MGMATIYYTILHLHNFKELWHTPAATPAPSAGTRGQRRGLPAAGAEAMQEYSGDVKMERWKLGLDGAHWR